MDRIIGHTQSPAKRAKKRAWKEAQWHERMKGASERCEAFFKTEAGKQALLEPPPLIKWLERNAM